MNKKKPDIGWGWSWSIVPYISPVGVIRIENLSTDRFWMGHHTWLPNGTFKHSTLWRYPFSSLTEDISFYKFTQGHLVKSLCRSHSPGWQWHIQLSAEQHWTVSERTGKSASALGCVCHNLVALRISRKQEVFRWLPPDRTKNRSLNQCMKHFKKEITERGWRFSSKISKSILPSGSLVRKSNRNQSLLSAE